jgi:hypothetical protein
MNIVIKRQKQKWHYSHVNLSFFFLRVYLEFFDGNMYLQFGSENYRDIRHTHLFSNFINLKIRIFRCGSMVSCDMWDHVIFPGVSS